MLIYSCIVPYYPKNRGEGEGGGEREIVGDQRHRVLAFQHILSNLCSFLQNTAISFKGARDFFQLLVWKGDQHVPFIKGFQ